MLVKLEKLKEERAVSRVSSTLESSDTSVDSASVSPSLENINRYTTGTSANLGTHSLNGDQRNLSTVEVDVTTAFSNMELTALVLKLNEKVDMLQCYLLQNRSDNNPINSPVSNQTDENTRIASAITAAQDDSVTPDDPVSAAAADKARKNSRKKCLFHRKFGICPKPPNTCTFRHDPDISAALNTGVEASMIDSSVQTEIPENTKCLFYHKHGNCRTPDCPFRHDDSISNEIQSSQGILHSF